MASYNGGQYIKQQLLSILKQLDENDEIIVSDDGSADNTINIIRGLSDKRIKIIEGPQTDSPIKNFEHALNASKGDIIFLADQDDVWVDGKVRTCVNELRDHYCVVTDAFVTDEKLNISSSSFFSLNKTKKDRLYNLFIKNGYLGCCMAFRREVLEIALPFPKDIPMHDIWIGNVAAFKFGVSFIHRPLLLFRRHQESSSFTASKSLYSMRERFTFRWNVTKRLAELLIHGDL